ncbi:hypothetical protein DJ030_14690 [bacterium endosymbiont of Escarpia laminata]|nr:MAG: hypothetical protein DJ030_14690 [bacterium endosymbiont of Escarpia laminata]
MPLICFVGVSRSVRTADASERYIASFMRMGAMVLDWVGNPELDPEQHHQIEAGFEVDGDAWSSGFTAYYNDVSDYILRDLARGQDGILLANGATIYRNIEARFYGLEWEGFYYISNSLSGRASLAYVNAENTTDSRPIAQIAPLEMILGADYTIGAWDLGATVRANVEQTRADIIDGSGQDVGETAGWVVLDLFGSYAVTDSASVRFGVNNLFDKTYAYHVNRANLDPFSPEAIQVNEPGRELWVKGSVKF